jgi:starvation-inducible outer membrane lipoprotein
MKKHFLILFLAFSLSACTWVDLTPEGEKVRVLSAQEVQSCTKKGKTTVSIKADVGGIERDREKVKTELETLARNSAVDLNGDTVVPTSEIKDGKQTFDVYRCVNP